MRLLGGNPHMLHSSIASRNGKGGAVVSPFTSYLSKYKEWLHALLLKRIYIYLSTSHMNWIRRITRHGIYCLFTLLQVTKWEQEEQLELGWAATSCTAPSQYTEYLHSIHYTPTHRQVWPELAHQPGPRSALAACNRLPWNRDSITTLLITLHITSFLYIFMLLKAK